MYVRCQTSLSGIFRLPPDEREYVLLGKGILVPIVEARFRKTKLNK